MKVWVVSLLSLDISAQVLTPEIKEIDIRSLVEKPTLRRDISSSALPSISNSLG